MRISEKNLAGHRRPLLEHNCFERGLFMVRRARSIDTKTRLWFDSLLFAHHPERSRGTHHFGRRTTLSK